MRKIRALAMAFYIVCGFLWSGTEALAAESGTAYAVPEENLPASETTADQIMTAAGLAVFLALAAAAAFFFFRRQKRKTGTLLAGILICGAAAAFLGGSVSALRGKGDLNGDGVVDYADVRLLKQHLTAIGLLSEEGADRADMDGSGALTITDLSLLIRRVENRLDYTVSVSPVLEQFYFEKGEEVSFRFQAEVPYGAWIERVMIGGEVYEVQNGLDSSMYTVMVPAGSAAGIRTYQMTKAYLNTGREADCRVSVDVLKTAPEVEAFAVEERTDTAQMQVSFTLRDEDAALSSASAEVLEKESGERILTETLAAGEQELLLDLEEDREYLFHIAADYRRDSGLLEVPADHSGSISAVKEMALGIDYQFAFGGMETAAEDGTRTAVFSKNQPVVLTFQSSNATVYHPDRIVVNGKTYPAERSGSGYSVTLAPFEKTGTAEIRAEQLVLENGKVFRLDENQKVTVEIQKERPQLDGLSVKEEVPGRQMRVAFQLTDPDGALQNCRVLIQTAEGQRAAELPFGAADLEAERLEAVIPLTDTSLTSSYTVQVLADWDLSPDGNRTELQKILGGTQIQAAPRMEIAGGGSGRSSSVCPGMDRGRGWSRSRPGKRCGPELLNWQCLLAEETVTGRG